MTISQHELTQKSQEFILFLEANSVSAALDEQSFRDYNCKIRLPQGAIVLYHKPSKKSFSIGTHEYKGNIEEIERLWHRFVYPNEAKVAGTCAYVDGSFLNGKCGWGLVLAEGETILFEGGDVVAMSAEDSARQIAGEVTAVLQALNFAKENNIQSLTVFFDYNGLQYWAEGKWKPQSPIAQYYVAKLMQYKGITIKWHKVAAHTGHPFNNRADKLAKAACGG
ncbi:MAG: RNase H family protein [Brevinema sp.]